jgi:hypothetical protein
LKTFANAASIMLTGVVSYLLLNEFTLTVMFIGGSMLVTAATVLYSHEPTASSRRPITA